MVYFINVPENKKYKIVISDVKHRELKMRKTSIVGALAMSAIAFIDTPKKLT